MKKLLIILLTTVYAISALGVSFNFFYCCHKLSHISISAAQPVDKCKPTSKSCCTNKIVSIKLTTDQDKTVVRHLSIPSCSAIVSVNDYGITANRNEEQVAIVKHPLVYPPPNQPSQRILYCIFRI